LRLPVKINTSEMVVREATTLQETDFIVLRREVS
jgi:hypothetical protein